MALAVFFLYDLTLTFLLYLGANTMWYLQFQVVCANVVLSNWIPPCSFSCGWLDLLLSWHRGFFVQSYKLFGTTRIAGGFLYINHNHPSNGWFALRL